MDGREILRAVCLREPEALAVATEVPAEMAVDILPVETLSVAEREIADKLIGLLNQYLSGLNFATVWFPKMIVKRLIEKLQAAHLPEESVGAIAEGVWGKLRAVNGEAASGEVAGSTISMTAEGQIVQDIMSHVDGTLAPVVRGFLDRMITAIGPEASGKIIRTVAREAWPSVRRRFKV